jgi:hypothetical protein
MAQKEPGDAARLWEQTREEIDPEGSDSEIMRQVNELAERIVREGSTAAQASRRQAAQDYAQAEKIGRQLAVNREKTS